MSVPCNARLRYPPSEKFRRGGTQTERIPVQNMKRIRGYMSGWMDGWDVRLTPDGKGMSNRKWIGKLTCEVGEE